MYSTACHLFLYFKEYFHHIRHLSLVYLRFIMPHNVNDYDFKCDIMVIFFLNCPTVFEDYCSKSEPLNRKGCNPITA